MATAIDRIISLRARKASSVGATSEAGAAWETSDGRVISAPTRTLARIKALRESGTARSADEILREVREEQEAERTEAARAAVEAAVKARNASPLESWLPRASTDEVARYHEQKQEQIDKLQFAEAGLPFPTGADAVRDYADSEWSVLRERGAARKYNANRAEYDKLAALPATPANAAKMALLNADMEGYIRYGDNKNEYTERKSAYDKGLDDTRARLAELKDTDWQEYERLLRETKEKTPRYNAEKQSLDEFSSSRQKSERAAYAEALKIEDEQYRLRADSGSKAYKSTVKLGQAEAERIAGFTADETTAATGDKSSPLTYTQQRIVNRIVHGASAAKPVSYEPGYVDVTGKDYYGKYDYLSDNEKTDFYYYLGKGDTDGAFRYLGMLGTTLEARETGKYKEDLSAAAKEDPAGGAFLQFMANFATPGDLLAMGGEALANAVRGDAKYEPARPSSSAYRASQSVSALGQGVEARIREGLDDTKPVFLGMTMADLAGQGYQLAQSIAQSGANMALFGPASIYVMGAQAAGNAAYNAAERGLAPDQAFLLGLGSGVVEAVTEKVSVDRFFKLLEQGKKLSAKQMLLQIAQQMVAEGSEEVVAEELNNLVDIFVAGDASEYARYKAGLVESGMSESEAEKSAMLQYFVKNAAVAGIGGAVSGGLFGGAGAVGNNARVAAYERAVQGAQAAQGGIVPQGGTVPQGRENSLPAAIQGDTARGNAARPDVAGLIQSGPNLSRQEAAAAALASGDTDVNAIFPAARNAGYNQGEREGAAADGVTADGDVSNLSSPWDLTAADVTELFDAYEVAREDRPDAQRAADIINKVQLGEQLGEAEVMLLVEYPEFASIAAEYESSELGGRGLADSAARQGDAGQVVTARDSTGQVNTQSAAQAGQAQGASVSGVIGLNGEVSGNGEQGGAQQRGEILDRGYGRVSDESDGVAVENVSGEQGQDYPAEVRRAADNRRNLLPNQGALSPRVSPESLGITGGFGYGSLLELPKSVWDEGLSASANEVRRTTGGNVRFVLGKIQVRGAGSTRGVLLANGDMVVQADDLGATAEQVTRHELFHALNKASGSVLVEAIRAEINRMFPDDSSLRGAIETYYKHYMKALAGHGLAREQIESYILEEIFADAYAGINAFGVDTSRWSEISARYANAAADRAASARSQTEAATARTTGPPDVTRFSVNPDFAQEIDEWDGRANTTFTVGSTSDALKSIGVADRGIVWHGQKIAEILRKHDGMSRDIIKQVPNMLERPVVVVKSRNSDSRIVIFGEVYDRKGSPVTAILELMPTSRGGELLDMNVVVSAYGKDSNAASFIRNSDLLYLDPDKNRTEAWLSAVGLQLPSVAFNKFGSVGSVSYIDGKVKIDGVPFTRNIPDSKAKSNRNSANNQSQSDSTTKVEDFTKDDITPEAIESNRDALQKYSIAFHGSPYSFDEFLLDHIGSGEGAQAHGWGLYFAADEKLAAKYKDVLSERRRNKFIVDGKQFTGVQLYDEFAVDSPEYIGSHALKDANGDVSGAVKFLRGVIADLERNEPVAPASVYRNATVEAANEAIAAISDGRVSYDSTPAPGALYTVDIPDEDVMLREDGTLWDQPDFIQDLLEEEFDEASYIDNATGRDVYLRLSDEYGKRGASEWLNERGIKGIVYGGRRDGKAYVVFDDKAIKILDKAAEVVSGGAEQRFSIGEAEDGTRFVEVDTDQHLFDGAAISDYPKIARRYIRARFRGIPLQVGTNGTARVSNRSAGEYAHSARPYKARAATELDNLLKVSKYSHSAPDESGRKFASDGWEYRAVKFRVDGVMFEGLINIAKSPNGALFYDMTNIEPSALNGQTKNSSSASLMAKSSVANNISNSGAKSNRNSAKNQSQSDSTIKVEDFTKFSLSEPIEATRDLIAVHNLSVGQLNESIRLGGFAMPSIAVTTSEMEHDRYGDVTVLFGRDTIDPKRSRNNRVYSGDAWTPSFPETGYKANSAVVRNARSIRNRLLEKYGLAYGDLPVFDASEVESDLRRSNGNLSEFYAHSNKMRLMYALDKGLAQPIYKAKDYGVAVPVEFFPALVEAVGEARITEAASGSSDLTRALAPVITETVNALSRDEYGAELFKKEIPFSQLDHVVDGLAKYIRNGSERELDVYATRDAVDAAMKDDGGYTRWLDGLFDGIVEKRGIRNSKDFFTNSGNRRGFEALYDEITLDNILKAMRKEMPKGGGSWLGTNGVRASASREFKSVDEIRGAAGQLRRLSEAEYSAAKDAVDGRIMGVINEMVGESESFSATDAAAEVLTGAVARSVEPGAIYNYVRREWGESFTPELARELSEAAKEARELPTEYFEAKPRRIVGFDEVRA
ncbi:MAG: hypothetical protein LBD92_02180, partial [Oscillospiraceae bacterium]|nr:hypothetical protein [Oscillospiraceae bacterium]